MEIFIYRQNPKTIRNFRWSWQRGIISADCFWPVWCYCSGKLGAGSVALRYRAIWNRQLHGLQLAPGVKIFGSEGFFNTAVSVAPVTNHTRDACRRLLLAVLSSAFNLGGFEQQFFLYFFISYICELFIDSPTPPPVLFFFPFNSGWCICN